MGNWMIIWIFIIIWKYIKLFIVCKEEIDFILDCMGYWNVSLKIWIVKVWIFNDWMIFKNYNDIIENFMIYCVGVKGL